MAATLREHGKVRRLGDVRVFPPINKRQGKLNICPAWRAALEVAGIPITGKDKFEFKNVRDICASYMVRQETSLYIVGDQLGHSDSKVTEKYAHLVPTAMHSASFETANR